MVAGGGLRRRGARDNAQVILNRLSLQLAARRRELLWRAVHWGWQEFSGPPDVTGGTPAGRAFAQFGSGVDHAFPVGFCLRRGIHRRSARTRFSGRSSTIVGWPGTRPGPRPGPVLRIGDRCVIGRGSHIVAHADIRIGDDVWTGPYVYITDQNHGYADPDTPIGRQRQSTSRWRSVPGRGLAAGAIVLPGARIGRNVVVAAGSVVRGTCPTTAWSPASPPGSCARARRRGWSRGPPTRGRLPCEDMRDTHI